VGWVEPPKAVKEFGWTGDPIDETDDRWDKIAFWTKPYVFTNTYYYDIIN
jgi:hypothetical protein